MEKAPRHTRIREALDKLYGNEPPHFKEYLRRFQEDPTSRVFAPLAESYRRIGRLDEAIDICREGIKNHPDFHGGRVALAKCYLDKKMYDEAQGELEKVIQHSPENLLAQKLLGDLHLTRGDKRSALHCFKMCLILSPQDVALHEKVRSLESSMGDGAVKGTETVRFVPEPEEIAPPIAYAKPTETPIAFQQPEIKLPEFEEDNSTDLEVKSQIDTLLGVGADEEEDEGFKVGNLSAVFLKEPEKQKEITTETLGDLYFSQGQFEKSLKIFEKLYRINRTEELQNKIRACKAKLGVDPEAIERNRKIELLKQVLVRTRQSS